MRAHYLQHVEFEGLGSIEPWLDTNGYAIASTRLFAGESLPDPTALDLLIVMGGPMSVNDEATLPWLAPEKAFVRACIGRGIPVLGVCLGAQMIAAALGSRIYRNPCKEIGWFPVERVTITADTFQFPAQTNVFHWHGETFELPALVSQDASAIAVPAVHLARNTACEHQAFQLGRRTIGLQFHLEVTPASARLMSLHCRDELQPARYVQTEEQLLDVPLSYYDNANGVMAQVLTYLTS